MVSALVVLQMFQVYGLTLAPMGFKAVRRNVFAAG
jgi:hypothetical protein